MDKIPLETVVKESMPDLRDRLNAFFIPGTNLLRCYTGDDYKPKFDESIEINGKRWIVHKFSLVFEGAKLLYSDRFDQDLKTSDDLLQDTDDLKLEAINIGLGASFHLLYPGNPFCFYKDIGLYLKSKRSEYFYVSITEKVDLCND